MLSRAIPMVLLVAALSFAEQLPIRVYTVSEGLAHNHINRIRQDSRGFLWFATDGGLSRFDGREFTRYTVADGLPHPWVNDLIEARDGTWWVATDGGVVQFNPRGTSERDRKPGQGAGPPMFKVLGPPGPQEARRVNSLAEDKDGSLLCATYDGLYRLRRTSGTFEFIKLELGPPSGKAEDFAINNLAASAQGGWWLAGINGLFRLFENGGVTRYAFANGLPHDFIDTVMEDHSGRIWAATRGHGFCQVRERPDSDGRIVERCYSTADGLPSDDVRAILQTSEGEFWIGTAEGLSEFDPVSAERPFRNYAGPNGLSDQYILKLAEDSDGNLWMGTRQGGVMRMPRERFVTFREQDGFRTAEHRSIFESAAGELVVLPQVEVRPFIQVFDGHRFQSFRINEPVNPDGFLPPPTGALQDRTGEWWIWAFGRELFRFPKSTSARQLALLEPKATYTVDGELRAVLEDAEGDLWIAYVDKRGGLAKWNRRTGTFRDFSDSSAAAKEWSPSALQQDAEGSLWVGLRHGKGLIRLIRSRFEPINVPASIFQGDVQSIHLSRSGQLWVATSQGGLIRVKNPDSEHPTVIAYTEAQGLSNNSVHCITEDQWGRIYAGTDGGVDRVNPATGTILRFTFADGLEKGSVVLAARDHHGTLWFVTNTGVSRLVPAPDRAAPVRTALISALRINGKPYPISTTGETELHGLEIAPGPNEVQVAFGSPAFPQGRALAYQYRLEGADANWNETTSDQPVHYANLVPGKYRFLVRSVSSDGIASEPALISFKVLTPFWRRWWFLALVFTAALLAVRSAYRYRVSHLLELERVRTRIATDLHDDIGSTLSQIAILSEVAQRRTNGQSPDVAGPLADIASISREVVESMSDIVWTIDPERDHLRALSRRMRRFATDVLTSRDIQLRFEAAGGEDVQLDPDVQRQFLLVLKEAVHNIVRHSRCSEAEIVFRVEPGLLRLHVWDNGNGFNQETTDRGQGLRSMRQRAERLGGQIHVASSPEHGTSIDLRVPLPRLARRALPHKYAGQISKLCNKLRLRNLLGQRHNGK
jgi:ligand-binding sensor domain-containing protein/two-component sensor histidine kinase